MGWGPDAPDPDPMIGEAAKANAEIGKEALALQREQYADQKALTDKYMPVFEEQIRLSQAEQAKSTARSDQQWESYQRDFAPLESELAKKALEYNTDGRQTMEADRAAADVSQNFGLARQRMAEDMAASGGLPGSGAGLANANAMAIEEAKARAGASNTARRQVESQGLAYLDNAARFGRNMSSTGLAAASLAGQQGGQAQGSVGGLSQLVAAPVQQSQGLFGAAVGANSSAGNLGLGLFNAELQGQKNSNAIFGDILKAGASIYGMPSSEKLKVMGDEVDDAEATKLMRKSPAKEWSYKPGLGDGSTQQRMGPTAESLAGTPVSDGTKIDMPSMLGLHHASLRDVDKRLAKLETKGKAKRRAGLSEA